MTWGQACLCHSTSSTHAPHCCRKAGFSIVTTMCDDAQVESGQRDALWDQLLDAFKWWLADYWKTNEGESLIWKTEAQLAVSCYASWVCKGNRWWSRGVSLWNEEWFLLVSTACSSRAWFTLSYFTKAETLSLSRYDLNCSVLLQRLTQLTQEYVGSHFYPLLAKDLKHRVKAHTFFTYFCCTDFSF